MIDTNTLMSTVAPALVSMKLLKQTDADRAHDLIDKGRRWRNLAVEAESRRKAEIEEAATSLVGVDEPTFEHLAASAVAITDPTVVQTIADRVQAATEREARAVVLARLDGFVPAVNKVFARIESDAKQLVEPLRGVMSAQAAIDRGSVQEWITAEDLRNELAGLRSLIGALRMAKLIPGPRGGDGGWAWMYRLPPDPNLTGHYSNMTEREKFLIEVARGPWCPVNADEAMRVQAEAEAVPA